MPEYVNLTLQNIDQEHLCCAISDKKHQDGVEGKRKWLKARIPEGHVFRKLKAKGKVFIEYAPLESAWTPVIGDDYFYIYCLWVAGSFKGNGYGKDLLTYVIEEAKRSGKKGICTISSKKKKPFLSEKSFLIKQGFQVVDHIGDYELLALSFTGDVPQFGDSVKKMSIKEKEVTIYYSPQCPFVQNSIEEIKEYSQESGVPIHFKVIDTLEKAKNAPCIFNNWAVFQNGEFVSNTLLNKNSIAKLCGSV